MLERLTCSNPLSPGPDIYLSPNGSGINRVEYKLIVHAVGKWYCFLENDGNDLWKSIGGLGYFGYGQDNIKWMNDDSVSVIAMVVFEFVSFFFFYFIIIRLILYILMHWIIIQIVSQFKLFNIQCALYMFICVIIYVMHMMTIK